MGNEWVEVVSEEALPTQEDYVVEDPETGHYLTVDRKWSPNVDRARRMTWEEAQMQANKRGGGVRKLAGPLTPEEFEAAKVRMGLVVEDKDLPLTAAASGFITKDSGERRQVSTGSQRDSREGKGRYDLLPGISLLKFTNGMRSGPERDAIVAAGLLLDKREYDSLIDLAWAICDVIVPGDQTYMVKFALCMPRLAGLYERGAAKYGDRNWEKGQPLSWYVDSGLRHLFMHIAGHRDEDHIIAALWNICGFLHTHQKICDGALPSSLNDFEVRS